MFVTDKVLNFYLVSPLGSVVVKIGSSSSILLKFVMVSGMMPTNILDLLVKYIRSDRQIFLYPFLSSGTMPNEN